MNTLDPMTAVSAATPMAGGQRYSDTMFSQGNSGRGGGGWMNPAMMQVSGMQAAYRYPGMRQMMGVQGRGMGGGPGGGMRQPGQMNGYYFNGAPAPVPGNPTVAPPADGIVNPLAQL